jgi:tetratricopeptide (TPR) repeat protein
MDIKHNFDETSKEKGSGRRNGTREKGAFFGLTDESGRQSYMNPDDQSLGRAANFLQKVHIKTHEIAINESIHKFIKEETVPLDNTTDLLSEEDEYLFSNVQQAFNEQDIIDLRRKLETISLTFSHYDLSSEILEQDQGGDLDIPKQELIISESLSDKLLERDIDLYREIDEAVSEKDIMLLRSELRSIIKIGSSHSRSVDEIEDYLSGELEEPSKSAFNEDLMNNHSLAAEVKLYESINEALGERDVMKLRADLGTIVKKEIEPDCIQKRGMFNLRLKNVFWYAAAASIILLLGLNIIWRTQVYTDPELYNEFYRPVNSNSGVVRSTTRIEESMLNRAMTYMGSKEYNTALKLFSEILVQDKQNAAANFYLGAIYQDKRQYTAAIQFFTNVITQGDNLFIEQSYWYLGLCYLGQDRRDKAIIQFRKLSLGNGYYGQQSIDLLKKLEQK